MIGLPGTGSPRLRIGASALLVALMLATCTCFGRGVSSREATEWRGWAKVAWSYYETSWNRELGLPFATSTWRYLTDWDLGGYLLAILAAERIEIVPAAEAESRIVKVLAFLETRPLTAERMPFRFYSSTDATAFDTQPSYRSAHPSDVGRLLLGLDEIRRDRPALGPRIEELLRRYDLVAVAADPYFGLDDIYPWYAAQGFHRFGIATPHLKPLRELADGAGVAVYGETFPKINLTSEPLLHALLELREVDPLYRTFADRLYRVQERRWRETQKLTAWSEGHYPHLPGYMYEWVVTETGDSWVVRDVQNSRIENFELVYAKVAFAFHALYHTEYSRTLVDRMTRLATVGGFAEGLADGEPVDAFTDKTNALILEAAARAIRG